MKEKAPPVCENHPDIEAVYQCGNCLKTLCRQCVKQDAHLFFCTHCGARATRMLTVTEPSPAPGSMKESVSAVSENLRALAALVTNHIVVPAAIIFMVGAFLFYLLDVRSVFLGDSSSLKRVGFLFGAATVLIARYVKMYAIRERQMLYTFLLAIATIIAMTRYSQGGLNLLVNSLVVIAVWHFATGVTNNLDLEEAERQKDEHRLYGVERLKHEEVERKFGLQRTTYSPDDTPFYEKEKKKKKSPKEKLDPHGNPSISVARLVVFAVFAFAVGEPFILSGPPEVGARALLAVIVFLLSAGVVLAAGSAMGTFRHTIQSGGDASLGMVPKKIAVGVLLLVVVLAAALTVPGIKYRGSGERLPAHDRAAGSIPGKEDQKGKSGSRAEDRQKTSSERGQRGKQPQSDRQQGTGQSGSGSIFDFIASLGKLLIIPLLLVFAAFVIYAMVKLGPNLKHWRLGLGDRLRRLLDKLKSLFRRRHKEEAASVPVQKDPRILLDSIQGLPPREAVLMAYECLLAFFEHIGHQRLTRLTPYEFLYSLPERLSYLEESTGRVTEVYVKTAYAGREPTEEEGRKVLEELHKIRNLIEARQKK